MKLIRPSYEILTQIEPVELLKSIEVAGRTCYKSEEKITEDSASKFVTMLLARGHESVLEHRSFSIKFVCDRGVSHEIVRHRLASFSQESTRYCNYSNDKFGNELTFIAPEWLLDWDVEAINSGDYINADEDAVQWADCLKKCEETYIFLLECPNRWKPEQARSVLPNSLKTEIVVTANLREWRTIFKQRTSKAAHPQMRELMCPLLDDLKILIPTVFDDINY